MSRIEPGRISRIWTFLRVVEAGGLTAAATSLGLTPSGVSKQVARLESDLGLRLLHRTTRALQPTEAGQALYQRCRHLFDAFVEAEAAAHSVSSELAGPIHVTTTPALGRHVLLPALGRFAAEHPQVSFDVTLSAHRLDLVEAGIDLAVREGDLADSSLTASRLMDTGTLLCAAPAYLEAAGTPGSVEELREHALLLPASPAGERLAARALGKARSSPRFRINDLASVHALALDGLGIAALSDYMVEEDLEKGRLVEVLPEVSERLGRRPIHAVTPEGRERPAKVTALVEFLKRDAGRRSHGPGGFAGAAG